MKLARIIAERFGELASADLGEFGDGLTVVLGPNEAGKTSFTTLVRYVLYGYPTRRDSEPDYESAAGKRLGRLIFAEDASSWAIERTEGPHGGPVAVHPLSGVERPGLLDEVTRGIGRDAFRVVFGFGLDEMAQIEAGRGAGIDILSRLYAARVGLDVSPSDVRAALEAEAAEFWRPRASNPELNAIKSRIADVKREVGDLETLATHFAEDQQRLAELASSVAAARSARDEAARRARELAAATQRLEDLELRIAEGREQSRAAAAELRAAQEKRELLSVDERVLSASAELEAVLADLSGFRERLRRAGEQGSALAALATRAASLLESAGLDEAAAAHVDLGPETLAGIERWRDKLAAAESQANISRRAADDAADALAAEKSAPGTTATARGPMAWLPGVLMLALGLALTGLGLLGSDYVQTALGSLVTLTGAVLLVRSRGAASTAGIAPRAGDLTKTAEQKRLAAERDAIAWQEALAKWRAWTAERGLGQAGDDPAAVSLLAATLKEYRAALAEQARMAAVRDEDLAACAAYRDRLSALGLAFAPELGTSALEDLPAHAARVREALDAATTADRARRELTAEIERLDARAKEAERRAALADEERATVLQAVGIPDADAARISLEARASSDELSEVTERYDALATEYTTLETRLDNQGRDSAMATLRQELAGLEERRETLLEKYSVLAVADRLMAETQAFNERERQPEVVRRASELFAGITGGRYERLSVPSDGGPFVVFDAASHAKPTSQLSTGTAQQLYLALRIALIETLDGVGTGLPVLMDDVLANFDPERKDGAARAIAHLATHRQVVLFTCHPETAEIMERAVPGRTLIALDRC